MDEAIAAKLRQLPSMDVLLRMPESTALIAQHGRMAVTSALRVALGHARQWLSGGMDEKSDPAALFAEARMLLEEEARPSLRPVFNLTGTVLHTNLGRAQLADIAIEAATTAMREAVTLEYDLWSGERGERDAHICGLLMRLCAHEHATVVNNNAAAVMLALNTLAAGREAIVSRGELIEIGGSFRLPDIMASAGVKLVEVGTTNRTHLRDYEAAITPETGVILKVHTSNYRIEGFTAEPEPRELALLARKAGIPLMNDLGSGTLIDLAPYGLKREPRVRDAAEQLADVITFSGDKLLGGPQAGFIVGRDDLIEKMNRNPMKRALRIDKIRLAAIEATLKLYRDPDTLAERLPTLRFLARPKAEILAQAERLLPLVRHALGAMLTVTICDCESQIGSGALPLDTIPSAGLGLRTPDGSKLDRLTDALRRRVAKPVIGRIKDGALILDLRCLQDEAGLIATLSALPANALA